VHTVITVCGHADQACPLFPGQLNRHHWGFDDPAHAQGTEEEILAVFRRVRDDVQRIFIGYGAGRRDAANFSTRSSRTQKSFFDFEITVRSAFTPPIT
jgi:arsenate reductase (thioredoxin)